MHCAYGSFLGSSWRAQCPSRGRLWCLFGAAGWTLFAWCLLSLLCTGRSVTALGSGNVANWNQRATRPQHFDEPLACNVLRVVLLTIRVCVQACEMSQDVPRLAFHLVWKIVLRCVGSLFLRFASNHILGPLLAREKSRRATIYPYFCAHKHVERFVFLSSRLSVPGDNTSVTQPFHASLAVVPIRGAVLCAIRNLLSVLNLLFCALALPTSLVNVFPLLLNGRKCFRSRHGIPEKSFGPKFESVPPGELLFEPTASKASVSRGL